MSDSSSEEEYKPRAPAFAMLDDSESDDEYDMAAFAGRNKGGSNLAMLMSDSDEEDEAAASESEEEAPAPAPAPAPSKSKKGKKKNVKAQEAADDLDALMANITAPAAKPAPAGGKKGKGKKGKGKKGPASTADDDDLDALLASVETAKSEPAATAAPAESKPAETAPADAAAAFLAQVAPTGGSKKKKGKKGKGKQQAAPEEDLDAVLAALEAPAAQQPSSDPPAKEAAPQEQSDMAAPVVGDAAAADAAADFLADLNIDDSAGASKKKNKKKRPKKKAAPAAEKEEDNKPLSAVAKRAQERLKKVAAEREQREREEAERKRQEEEERKAREEEERKQAELKEQRAARRKAKKEEQLKSGTYMTKAQRQKAAAGRARLQAMIDAGMIAPGAAGIADGDSSPKSPAAQAKTARKTKKATTSKAKPAPAPAKKVEEPQPKKPAEPVVDISKTIAGAAAWDDSSDDEAKPSAAATALQPGKLPVAVVAAAGGGAAWDADSDEEDIAAKKALHEKLTLKLNAERAGTRPATKTRAWDASSGDDDDSDDGSDDGSDDSSDVDSEEDMERRIHESRERRQVRRKAAMEARDPDNLRSPIICIMGHVDTGKTKLLDKIRRTNVQEGEAGGITQQIGATFFPMDRLRAQTDKLNRDIKLEYKLPGLLVIDTPGHESFTNLRTRGSSLCDLAILVVDVMHGLEKQTLESLNILRGRKTPFIVALNKVDRMYGWKPNVNNPIRDTLAKQESYAISEFETRTKNVLAEFQAQGLNAKLYYENDDFKRNVSVVPTSAITGEGIPDLLMLLVQLSQQMMRTRMQKFDDVQCSLLEVKSIPGLGTTVDAILVNGTMREGDTIVACGMNGPIVTQVRALLTPKPMKEMRVKGEYVHHKSIEGSMGIKIAAHNLEKALAGTPLLVKHPEDEIEDLKEEVMEDLEKTLAGLARESRGVWVQASTLGSLEALMEYLRSVDPPVPVAGVNIGPVHKRDVIGASIMLEHVPEYAVILAFDVKITPEAAEQAEDTGVRIFTADIIYHLTDQFDQYMLETRQAKQSSLATEAVFPVVARIIPTAIFNAKSPIVVGMEVVEGVLKPGTPLCVLVDPGAAGTGHVDLAAAQMPGGVMLPNGKMILQIGRVASIENNHTAIPEVRAGGPNVAVKIDPPGDNPNLMIGRHFTAQHSVYSRITRGSIDVLKSDFREQMTKPDWQTVIALKKLFYID